MLGGVETKSDVETKNELLGRGGCARRYRNEERSTQQAEDVALGDVDTKNWVETNEEQSGRGCRARRCPNEGQTTRQRTSGSAMTKGKMEAAEDVALGDVDTKNELCGRGCRARR